MTFKEYTYNYQEAIERIISTIKSPNKSNRDIINLAHPNIPNKFIKPKSFFSINGINGNQIAIVIKINFHEAKVPFLKYKCCISEINSALLADSIFKFEIHPDNNFILAKYDIFGVFKTPHFIDYYNKIRHQFYTTILRLSSIIDILNVQFKINGYSCIEAKIGISCRKLEEAERMCLICPANAKIMLDKDAFDYIDSLIDEDNKKSLKINNELNCYQGSLINKAMNKWVVENNNFQPSNPREINTITTHNIKRELDKNLLKNSICPICNGDGGTRGGCSKCEGTGLVTEQDISNYSSLPKALYGGRGDSKISNYDYIGGHIGAHYRDRDGTIGSIPDYDKDE